MTQPAPGSPPPADSAPAPAGFAPGVRVRITKQVARQVQSFSTAVEGVVVAYEQRKTGSWYAHAKDDKLWLDRLEVRKDDGEVYVCNIDNQTRIEVVAQDPGGTGVPPVMDGRGGHPTGHADA